MPTTVTVSFPNSGTLTAKASYTSSEPGPTYSQWYFVNVKQVGTSTKTSTNNLVLPQGCEVYKITASTYSNDAMQMMVNNGGITVSKANMVALTNYFTSLAASADYNGTISVVYRYNGYNWPSPVGLETEQDMYFASITRTHTATFPANTLSIIYYTAEEIAQGIVPGDDILPDEADGNISFIIEPYGENRQRYGVAIGGAPTSQSNEIPSFDCYIPTTFTNTTVMTLNNDKFIYQIPLWTEVPYANFANNYYPHDMWSLEYCCINSSIYLKGFVNNTSTTWALNKVICTLPEECWPSYTVIKECPMATYALRGSKKGYAVISIGTNGQVKYVNPVEFAGTSGVSNTDHGDSSWICLDLGYRK